MSGLGHAIEIAIKLRKKKKLKEAAEVKSFEQYLTELSVKTLQSYIEKAKPEADAAGARMLASDPLRGDGGGFKKSDMIKYRNRSVGIASAQLNIAAKQKSSKSAFSKLTGYFKSKK